MSALNGDKARFNRLRKQKIARRTRNRALLNAVPVPKKPAGTPSRAASRSVPA